MGYIAPTHSTGLTVLIDKDGIMEWALIRKKWQGKHADWHNAIRESARRIRRGCLAAPRNSE